MATVKDILARKSSLVHTISASASVVDAAAKMSGNEIGCLVVTADDNSVIGIIAERDLVRRIATAPESLSTITVGEVMTKEVVVCTPSDRLDDVRSIMKTQRVRQIPVVHQGKLHGIVSMGDANAHLISEDVVEIKFLHDYIVGAVR